MERTYSHIDLDERRRIARWRTAKLPVDIIAEKLGRHRSTIFRELKRNQFNDDEIKGLNGYYCTIADQKSRERRSKQRKLIRFDQLRQSVIQHISDGWSPQQIAGRMRLERHPIAVSHETIYQFVYSANGRKEELWKYLPERRAKRRPRHARRRYGRRFTVLLLNNDRQSRPVIDGVIRVLQPLPQMVRRSITFDPGTEFTEWAYLQNGIGSQTWFCDPQSPWQKGTVENTNRRTRRWLPRDIDPLTLSDRFLAFICYRLNNTPRKCLGYKTPAEVFRQKLFANRHRYA